MNKIELNIADSMRLAADLLAALRFSEAESLFRRVVELDRSNFLAAHAVGICLIEQGRNEESLSWFDRAGMIMREEMITLSFNRGKALGELGRTPEALSIYDNIVKMCPNHALAYYNRGLMLMQGGDYFSAIQDFNESLRLNANNDKALFGRGFANLVLGNYKDGFRDYEFRLKDDIGTINRPLWDGSQPLSGKTILVHGEQGHGDSIMFMRYLPMLVDRGANVIAVLHPGVAPLAAHIDGVKIVSEDKTTWPEFDYWVRTMSLALAFGTTENSIPPPIGIKYNNGDLGRWRKIIGNDGFFSDHFKIGLCWAGSPKSRYDANRSVPLSALAPLFDRNHLPNIQLYSLQKDIRESDVEAFKALDIIDLSPWLTNFYDTAHAMKCLDLVVTVDTSIAHLAGTVGIPTIVMLTAFRTYWLWIEKMETSPWYPSVRLFRQKHDGNWPEVVSRVADELREKLTAAKAA